MLARPAWPVPGTTKKSPLPVRGCEKTGDSPRRGANERYEQSSRAGGAWYSPRFFTKKGPPPVRERAFFEAEIASSLVSAGSHQFFACRLRGAVGHAADLNQARLRRLFQDLLAVHLHQPFLFVFRQDLFLRSF